MNKLQLTIMAALLAAGCAHGKSEASRARAAEEPTRSASAEVDPAEATDESERVDIPAQGKGRGRLASAGDELPSDKKEAKPRAEDYGTEADNTRVNERDREESALTPMDQSEATDDRELTQRIRKAVVGDDSLSFTAKNVKIITRDGQVTLRGSVNNERERNSIERAARDIAGPTRVVNELEVSE